MNLPATYLRVELIALVPVYPQIPPAIEGYRKYFRKEPSQIWFPPDLYLQTMYELAEKQARTGAALADPVQVPVIESINGLTAVIYVPEGENKGRILLL